MPPDAPDLPSPPGPAERFARLLAVTTALATALHLDGVVDVVLREALDALGAGAGSVVLADDAGAHLDLVGQRGYPAGAAALPARVSLDEPLPVADAYRDGEARFLPTDALRREYPRLLEGTAWPRRSVAALPLRGHAGVIGVLALSFAADRAFPEDERVFARTLADVCAQALERARALDLARAAARRAETFARDLEARVEARTRELDEERAALDAFAAFTESVGTETDAFALARRAVAVVRDAVAHASAVYYEPDGAVWRARVVSDDVPGEVARVLAAGIPADTPSFARALAEREAVFVDGWNAIGEGLPSTTPYGATALVPLMAGGAALGLFTVGTRDARAWTGRERLLVRAVGRGLALALERAHAARRLAEQNAELDARTRALEGFAELTRDLAVQGDPGALVGKAQDVMLSLLPPGYALYFEPELGRWRKRSQRGDPRDAALQAFVDAGVPFEATEHLVRPFAAREPVYQDAYDVGDNALDPALTTHIGATATLPVVVEGVSRGVLVVALFGGHTWTATDRAVLESVTRSLGVALERSTALRALAAVEHRLRTVVDRTPVVLYALDRAGVFTLAEGSGLRALGLTPAHFLDRSVFVLSENTPEIGEAVRRALMGEEVQLLARQRDRVFDTWYAPLIGDGGVEGVVGLAVDVTDRLAREAEVRRANEELRRSNAELEQFAFVASHDLQAPIRAVTSFANAIERRHGERLDERGRAYLRQISESGRHMKRLVDDLLTFSRVHTEQRPAEPVDAGAALERALARLAADVETAGAEVRSDALPVVSADPGQLDSLLQNLLSNALKYRRDGVPPRVRVSAAREGTMWRLSVADNGIGIEAAYFERIFEIFQRLHPRERFEGTGIGLAVCKKIVERHGGRLWVESVPGEGSVFSFTLPGA